MKEEIQKALEVLRKGGVILYPTDTVWGIGCDATDPEAVAKVYAIKKREDSKSLVLLASDMDMICRYVKEVPEMAVQLVEVNDKPMTIIYPGAVTGDRPAGPGAPVVKSNHTHTTSSISCKTLCSHISHKLTSIFNIRSFSILIFHIT